jgi:Arc/MetJ-type ribon-helix-helix transcriptional regulator
MRKRKPVEERVMNAGISLPARFVEEVREAADFEGFPNLSGLVRRPLTQWLRETKEKWDAEDLRRQARHEAAESAAEQLVAPIPKSAAGRANIRSRVPALSPPESHLDQPSTERDDFDKYFTKLRDRLLSVSNCFRPHGRFIDEDSCSAR